MRLKRLKVRSTERGLLYRDGVLQEVLGPGTRWVFDPFWKLRLETVSVREPWLAHRDLEILVRHGMLPDGETTVVELNEEQRAVVRVNGRFETLLGPGLYALWTVLHDVDVDRFEVTEPLIDDEKLLRLARQVDLDAWISLQTVAEGQRGLLFVDGRLESVLAPGRVATWKRVRDVRLVVVDVREQMLDISGQDILTADSVTLRLNAVVTFRVTDPERAATLAEDWSQVLYREGQLALRASVGVRELDQVLAQKDELAEELRSQVVPKALSLGVEVISVGVRDVILPGEMKVLLNRVTEAKKAAEANLVTRREETAAMRSQANTAKLLENNPALMRLRELEVLEKVASNTQLTVLLGEGGLAEKVSKLM